MKTLPKIDNPPHPLSLSVSFKSSAVSSSLFKKYISPGLALSLLFHAIDYGLAPFPLPLEHVLQWQCNIVFIILINSMDIWGGKGTKISGRVALSRVFKGWAQVCWNHSYSLHSLLKFLSSKLMAQSSFHPHFAPVPLTLDSVNRTEPVWNNSNVSVRHS